MGRATVRAGIGDYLAAADITGLTTVLTHPPKVTDDGQFIAPTATFGGLIYVHLGEQSERRIAMGGPTAGMKMRLYRVSLVAVFRGVDPSAENTDAANDVFIDSLVAAIEANRTPAGVWQWGEGDTFGAPDIDLRTDLPHTLRQQTTQIWNVLTVSALELLQT
jgi:hypothetical protein